METKNKYRVSFNHPTLSISFEDVEASSHIAAEAAIASKYGLASRIKACPWDKLKERGWV